MANEINASNKTCVIIGNGFDINLGLPTSYNNFVESEQFNDMVYRGNELAIHLKNKYELQNWIDIENELKTYSKEIEDVSFKRNFELLTFALIQYINNLNYSIIKTSSLAYKLISTIAEHCNDFIILDYNYTQSIELILRGKYVADEIIKNSLIKVHGEASKNDIIFGVEDNANIRPEHVFLRKAYPRYYKALNFNSIFNEINDLIFFGHSLGETDHTYFQRLFSESCSDGYNPYSDNKRNKAFHFYYYTEDGYHKLMQQIDALTYHKLTSFRQFNNVKFINVEQY